MWLVEKQNCCPPPSCPPKLTAEAQIHSSITCFPAKSSMHLLPRLFSTQSSGGISSLSGLNTLAPLQHISPTDSSLWQKHLCCFDYIWSSFSCFLFILSPQVATLALTLFSTFPPHTALPPASAPLSWVCFQAADRIQNQEQPVRTQEVGKHQPSCLLPSPQELGTRICLHQLCLSVGYHGCQKTMVVVKHTNCSFNSMHSETGFASSHCKIHWQSALKVD